MTELPFRKVLDGFGLLRPDGSYGSLVLEYEIEVPASAGESCPCNMLESLHVHGPMSHAPCHAALCSGVSTAPNCAVWNQNPGQDSFVLDDAGAADGILANIPKFEALQVRL